MNKFLSILTVITIILSIMFVSCETESMKDGEESTQDETEQINTTEQEQEIPDETDITETKKYLEDNYDKFNIDGSTSMIPLHQSLNDLFSSGNKNVVHSKTVDAFEKFITGENDILLGVDYSDELLDIAKANGIDLVKIEITREAFVFLININNPVKSLTIDQIKDIYSGKITNWSEVGGENAKIKAYQRNSDSGSQMRMVKFMGDTLLAEQDVEYISSMGSVVEIIGNYDGGKYSIGYNMYTFTEKQYMNENIILLDVNGVSPNDGTVFDEAYPIVIYNYIYYNVNNESAGEFAENLYLYLMSGEGQKLISDSGYVNLNQNLDRNKSIEVPYEYEDVEFIDWLGFYNEEKGEYYANDWDTGELLIFYNYADYVLHGTKYIDDEKAREYLMLIFNSDIPKNPYTAGLYEDGMITLNPWFDASFDPDDFFNYKYENMYYAMLTYHIEEDKFVLTASDQRTFDNYVDYFDGFSAYTDVYVPDAVCEITWEDLKDLYLRTFEWVWYDGENDVVIEYIQPFRN
ncbi:MAG: substrate-binding domain-containing protein [Oscillospiraceae bacterium]|nr:substrate-binding domain-containing protein [Oscillospiraceae bacterium]